MLSSARARALCGLVLLGLAAAVARAQDDQDGLQRPERLTIGTADQFLGTLTPDGRTLYFASNRNSVTELYGQDVANGSASLLFDEGADVTWPRVSPDGKHLLYVSFRDDAAGQLCVRPLPKGDRTCLRAASGAVQAQWLDAGRVLLLSRPAAQADMRVSIVTVGRRLDAQTLFDRNLMSLAVSPDGRWLVYTPLERYVERIGPGFAAKAGPTLMAQRLDRPALAPVPLVPNLPGLTAQAAFGTDGRAIYFVQFAADSNHDGVIDAGDNGLLYRVAFDPAREDAPAQVAAQQPLQLSDSSWNCQYPAPGAQRLVATCARNGRLDVYGLPLSGEVPADWDEARLRAEVEVTTNEAEGLLLHARLLSLETEPAQRRAELVSLIRLHLGLDEFEAAEFYATQVSALKDKATAGLGSAMRILCEHRRALRARERGHLALSFAEESRARIDRLKQSKAASPAGGAARQLVRSEIADVLGDKTQAREALETMSLEGVELPAVLELYADRADALYRELDEREPLVEAYHRLSVHPAASPGRRLAYARAAVRALTRGLGGAERDAALERAPAGDEIGLAVELTAALSAINDAHPSAEAEARVVELYRKQTTPERRRAVMLDAVQRGWDKGAQGLLQRLAELYVRDVPRGTVERRRAARMYRRLLEDRAYAHLGEGKKAEARDDFLAVARNVGSLESWAGYIDRRLQENATVEQLEAEHAAQAGERNGPVGRFVRAYLLARKLHKMKPEEAGKANEEAAALVRGAWSQLKGQPEAVSLLGAIFHERYLRTGDRAIAQRASALYLIALDLARRNPRYRAMLLAQMAILQAQVGNWRIAIDYFEQREKLPFVDNLNGLTHSLIKARTLLHLDREREAAKLADEALATVERTQRMAPFKPLVLDRAALYNLAASRFDRALALYDQLVPIIDAERGPVAARNRLVTHLARAAAALGAKRPELALDTLSGIERTLGEPGIASTLAWPHATHAQALWTYRLVTAGLRAKAALELGRLPEAKTALQARRALYEEQRRKGGVVDEHVRAAALVETQLAEVALAEHSGDEALRRVKAALDGLDPLVRREGKPFDRDQLVTLWLGSEARLQSTARLQLKLRDRIGAGISALASQGDEKTQDLMRWLEIYMGMMGRRGGRAAPTAGRGSVSR